jgi:phosphoribosylaminoimidazolecarboxamide formyltransferase/IMP cyclohydrolase
MRRALISVSDKTDLLDFARHLTARGFEIVSTGGTAKTLTNGGLSVTAVSTITGFPEMLDGRVKTLHPVVHGGILARRSHPADVAALAAHGIAPIDLVVVNLYPFVKASANPDIRFDELIEEIDIGGPSLVRAAAKNFTDVLVVVAPADYSTVIEQLDRPGGPSIDFRFELARKAFAHTAAYDTAIASTLASVTADSDGFRRQPAAGAPAILSIGLRKVRDLRYGENPHQAAAWYAEEPPAGLGGATVLQGKELSYTNLLDLDAAARIVLEFDEPAAAVIKHTNPCGAATGAGTADAYVRARDADPLAAFGGIVGLNRAIDADAARAIVSTFIEAVVAPAVEEEARPILATKANMRVVTADFSSWLRPNAASAGLNFSSETLSREFRTILGAMLVQDRDRVAEARAPWPGSADLEVVTRRQPTADEWQALRFAWRICAHVKSNTVIFTGPDRTLAIGAGQMSRVDSVNVAKMKAQSAGDRALAGSVAASDAFFPFRDGLDAVAAAGATAVVQPGGSVRDPEVIAAADEHAIAMVFTGRRHFRH